MLLLIAAVAVFAHELGHALALVHYGGSVSAAGFRLHLGTPSFYIESADAVLLTRRERMIQAGAGPWAEWLVTSVIALTLWRSPIPMLIPVLHRFVVLNTATIASNLLPFAGLDGYWLLADGIHEPDLAVRSRLAVPRIVRSFRSPDRWSLDQLALAGYAVLNGVVAALLLATAAFFWYELFGGLLHQVAALGGVGWVVIAAFLGGLLRPAALALRSHVSMSAAAVGLCMERIRFRAERRWRVRATRRLCEIPQLAEFNARGLGIIAGSLERVRLEPGALLVREGFAGLVMVSSGSIERFRDDPTGHGVGSSSVWEAHHGLRLGTALGAELILVPQTVLQRAAADRH